MPNHEERPIRDKVHLFLAFRRHKNNPTLTNECIRVVIRDYDLDLFLLEQRCKKSGGIWRIHHTVNARDTEKARKWLIHKLIDNPGFAGCVDSIWKTALLQTECKAKDLFLFDVDTKDESKVYDIYLNLPIPRFKIETPNGWHFVTIGFDAREVCKLLHVTLIRDGYYFIKEVG